MGGCLLVGIGLRDRRVSDLKPASTKDPSRMRVWCILNLPLRIKLPLSGVVGKFMEGELSLVSSSSPDHGSNLRSLLEKNPLVALI
ncbi:hypothetical protein AVEN_268290-1 [Araneus ventricosus]|uniref:Uncharacterized protein n=1 Tax=Araneus ventricosus TaxID=182803 RepID=A0A4Y2C3J5_ARAVE|nr:hypothetical protein AVEN_268290-1 [Araneus ventricosus]